MTPRTSQTRTGGKASVLDDEEFVRSLGSDTTVSRSRSWLARKDSNLQSPDPEFAASVHVQPASSTKRTIADPPGRVRQGYVKGYVGSGLPENHHVVRVGDDFCFTTSSGARWTHGTCCARSTLPPTRAGLQRKPFHHLRHACATLLLESGEELAKHPQDPRPCRPGNDGGPVWVPDAEDLAALLRSGWGRSWRDKEKPRLRRG